MILRTDQNKRQISGFVDSGFVKTCDELVIERNFEVVAIWDEDGSELEEEAESLNIRWSHLHIQLEFFWWEFFQKNSCLVWFCCSLLCFFRQAKNMFKNSCKTIWLQNSLRILIGKVNGVTYYLVFTPPMKTMFCTTKKLLYWLYYVHLFIMLK